MYFRKLSVPAILACLLLQLQVQAKPTALPAGFTKVTSVEGITEYAMPNGLHVLIFPDPSKPTVTVNITYKVGSRMEGYGETGMAHLLEHMMFKGSTNHKNVPQELTTHGSSPNGTTSYDRTNYFETFSATDENLNWALSLEADRMVNSFIAEKDLKSEFSVVRNEFESGENSPSNILMERILSTAYLWHNYGKSTIGSKEDIERVPIKNLQAFYKKYYQPDNAVLLVAGKIDEEKTLDLVKKYFATIPKPTRVIDPTYTMEPAQDGERNVELRRVGDVQSIACAYHVVAGSDPAYPVFDVISEVLTNEPNGRLYQDLVKTGKASSVWSYAQGLKDPGFLYINADIQKEKSQDEAKQAFYKTLDDLKDKPVTQEEVDKAKSTLNKNFEQAYRNSEYIGLAMSEFIGQGDWRLAFLYRDNLQKVTADDVNKTIATYLIKSNRTTGLFIPTTAPKRTTVPEAPDVASLVKDYKGKEALKQAEAFDPSPENIEKRTERGTIAGGAKYALLTKTTRGSTVNGIITIRLGSENSLENKATIASLTAAMLKRGTTNRTMAQINESLDKLSSSMEIYGGGQTVSIVIQSTKQNLPQVLDIVDDVLHNPAFSADEFKTLRQENIVSLQDELSEPQSIAFRQYSQISNPRPKGHISYSMTAQEEIDATNATNLDDIKAFYKKFYGGGNATVAFVGEFENADVKKKLEKTFGNWNASEPYARVKDHYDDITPQDKEIKTPDKKNAMFVAGMNLKMRDDNADFPAMVMGDFIFGGGFLNSRLATRIRQKEGVSYGVGSFLQVDSKDETGAFMAYAIYNPDNKAKLESAFKDELSKMLQSGFTDDELKAAKSGIIQYRQNGRADDGQLANKLNNYLNLDRTMAWDKSIDQKMQSLSTADVNSAMKKYISSAKITYVKAGDFVNKPQQ